MPSDLRISWSSLSDKLNAGPLSLSYMDAYGSYYIYVVLNSILRVCKVDKSSQDGLDFESNYKSQATSLN